MSTATEQHEIRGTHSSLPTIVCRRGTRWACDRIGPVGDYREAVEPPDPREVELVGKWFAKLLPNEVTGHPRCDVRVLQRGVELAFRAKISTGAVTVAAYRAGATVGVDAGGRFVKFGLVRRLIYQLKNSLAREAAAIAAAVGKPDTDRDTPPKPEEL